MSPALRNASPRFISARISAGERRGPGEGCTDGVVACGSAASRGGAGMPDAFGCGSCSARDEGGVGDGGAAGGLSETAGRLGAGCAGCGDPTLGMVLPGEGADPPAGAFTSGILNRC